MALKRKYGIYALLILICGLVSCFKDKEVVYAPQRVQTGAVGTLDSQHRMIAAKDIKQLELGGQLTVDLLREQDFKKNPLLIKTEANCSSEALNETGAYISYFENKTAIPVIRILSDSALLSISQQPLRCNITLRISNSMSSEEIYLLQSVQISDSSRFNNIETFAEAEKYFFYDSLKSEALAMGEDYQLKCTDFQKMVSSSNEINWEFLLNSNPMDMKTWKKSTQICRLLITGKDQIQLSRPFQLIFQPTKLILQPTLYSLPNLEKTLTSRKVLSLRVINPNPFHIQFKLHDLFSSQVHFIPIYSDANSIGRLGQQRTAPLLWVFPQTPYLVSSNETEWYFDMPPAGEFVVDAHIQVSLNCEPLRAFSNPMVPGNQQRPAFVGIKYGFDFGTKFLTQLNETEWSDNPLTQGVLSQQQNEPLSFVDVFYRQFYQNIPTGRQKFATNEEFIAKMRLDLPYDACKAL